MQDAIPIKVHDELASKFDTSSWAIWSEEFPSDESPEYQAQEGQEPEAIVELVKQNHSQINPSTILLGVNPSGELVADYWNFHSNRARNSDIWLKRNIQEAGLSEIAGAYMTDLFKGVETSQHPELRAPTDDEEESFCEELEILGQDEYTIICFGQSKFDRILEEWFGSDVERIGVPGTSDIYSLKGTVCRKDVQFYVVHHYSQGHHRTNGEQLAYINNILNSGC